MRTSSFFRTLILLIAPAATLLALCSCSVYWHEHAAEKDLNDLQRVQNYWGRISISGPHWIADTNQFKVTFNEDATNYAQAARANVAGGQASSLQTSLFLGQSLQGTFTPPVSAGQPSGGTNPPGAPPPIPTNAEAALGGASFSPLFSLLTQNPVPDERQVVNKAINDKIAEQLLELIASPTFDSNQEQVMFGVMQITCQPGQRTSRGFTADLSVNLSYEHTETHPTVLAVLPLVDSENVQLQQSDRSQVELAQALSAAFAAKGMNAAANSLADYVKRQQSDIGTRNSLPIVTTYASDSTFGFQIYPSLQAVEHPGKTDSKSGNVLQPITFPAVAVIRISATDFKGGNPASDPAATTYLATAVQTNLVAYIRTRWIDEKRPFWYPILGHDMFYKTMYPSEASLYEDIYEARHLDKADKQMQWLETHKAGIKLQFQALETAYHTFKSTSVSTQTRETLPGGLFKKADTNAPTITDVFPHLLWRNRETTFAILGMNLDGCTDVTIAGIKADHVVNTPIATPSSAPAGAGSSDFSAGEIKEPGIINAWKAALPPRTPPGYLWNKASPSDQLRVAGGYNDMHFSIREIVNLPQIVSLLEHHSDDLSYSLWTRLSFAQQARLTLPLSRANYVRVQADLVELFNSIVAGPCIYDPSLFHSVQLRPVTVALLKKSPAVPDMDYLNRLLLEDAYPTDLHQAAYNPALPTTKDVRDMIVRTLNSVIRGSTIIYGPAFQSMQLRPETVSLMIQNPLDQPRISRLNRLLIEDAYPVELSKEPAPSPAKSQVIYATLSAVGSFSSITNATNSIDFVVSGPHGRATKTIAVPLAGETTADPVVAITRDPNTGKVTGLDLKHGENLGEERLLEAVEEILRKSEPPPKTIITKP